MSNPSPLVDTADHHGGRRAVEEQGSEVGRVTFLHFFSMLPSYHGSHDDPAQWHPKRYEKRERRNTRAQNVTEGRKGCGNDWRQRQIKRKRKKRKKKSYEGDDGREEMPAPQEKTDMSIHAQVSRCNTCTWGGTFVCM